MRCSSHHMYDTMLCQVDSTTPNRSQPLSSELANERETSARTRHSPLRTAEATGGMATSRTAICHDTDTIMLPPPRKMFYFRGRLKSSNPDTRTPLRSSGVRFQTSQRAAGHHHEFSCGKDVIRDIPPPSRPLVRGKHDRRLHCAVASCKLFSCHGRGVYNVLVVTALDRQMSRGEQQGRTPREGGAEERRTEHGSGAACAEAAGR